VFICVHLWFHSPSRHASLRPRLVSHRHGPRRIEGARRGGRFCGQVPVRAAAGCEIQRHRPLGPRFQRNIGTGEQSYYPLQSPGTPAEVDFKAWTDAPASSNFSPSATSPRAKNSLEIQAWLNDARNASLPPVIGKVYRGEVTDTQVRTSHTNSPMNHQQTVGWLAGNRQHADRVRKQSKRQQGNLGDGLRR